MQIISKKKKNIPVVEPKSDSQMFGEKFPWELFKS